MYYVSMIMVIVFNIIYHISQKSIAKDLNPFVSMIVTYATALIATLILLLVLPGQRSEIPDSMKAVNWACFALGIGVVGLEAGFLLVYRSGWDISIAAVFANILVALLLIPIGILFYKDKINLTNAIGIALSIIGIFLMNKR